MEHLIKKWIGIISGTNRGIVVLDLEYIEENRVVGQLKIFDTDKVALSCELNGKIEGINISGKVNNILPQGEGLPTSGNVDFTLKEGGKEMTGIWKTDINTNGKCVLYKYPIQNNENLPLQDPNLTLETKDISISFSTFDHKNIKDIFSIMNVVANAIRKGSKQEVLSPIYAITYDKEERIRTYDFNYFLSKFTSAKKVWYIGFEFKNKRDLTNIYINISRQEKLSANLRSNVLVESTNKKTITLIPEMVRGLVSKTRNKHSICHKWFFDAGLQLLGVFCNVSLVFFCQSSNEYIFQHRQKHRGI